jgi:hypothetical protein
MEIVLPSCCVTVSLRVEADGDVGPLADSGTAAPAPTAARPDLLRCCAAAQSMPSVHSAVADSLACSRWGCNCCDVAGVVLIAVVAAARDMLSGEGEAAGGGGVAVAPPLAAAGAVDAAAADCCAYCATPAARMPGVTCKARAMHSTTAVARSLL